MKKLFFLFFILPVICFAKGPEIQFLETTHDFGNIAENGGKVSTTFRFKNVGDAPLVILETKVQCGCTKPEFPDKPIQPGQTSEIKITYNPLGHPGEFNKRVTVVSNAKAKPKIRITIKGVVIPAGR